MDYLSQDAEFSLTYQDLLILEWRNQVKVFIDWFVIKYNRFISSRCIRAANRIGMPELWEDLKSESIIEAYAVGERFDPSKGDLLKLLISSLWLFPMRSDKVNKVKSYSRGYDWQLAEYNKARRECDDNTIKQLRKSYCIDLDDTMIKATVIHYLAMDEPANVYCLDSICSSLEEQDQILLSFKYKLNLPNTVIGSLCGLNESTIRSRINNAIDKLQCSIKMKGDIIVKGA